MSEFSIETATAKLCESDPRVVALVGIIYNLVETPADQSDDFLAVASNLATRIKGLCESEAFVRILR